MCNSVILKHLVITTLVVLIIPSCKEENGKSPTEDSSPQILRAENQAVSLDEDTSKEIVLKASGSKSRSIAYEITKTPKHGTLNGKLPTLTYVPYENFNGSDAFSFNAADDTSSSSALISITVNPINDVPTATNGALTLNEDSSSSGTLSANDLEGPSLTYSVVNNGAKGVATITNSLTGAFTYAPSVNANGSDSFTFKVSDGSLSSSVATVSITINPVNDAPVAQNGSITTNEDNAVSGTLVATDIDSASLTYSIVTNGSKGSAVITNAATGAYTYTPSANANGPDSFSFRANDGSLNSNTATITVTINPINDAPIANNGSLTTDEDTARSGMLSGSDPEGSPLTFSIVSNGSKGSAAITNASKGAFTYTPNANANGSDSFTFKVRDGSFDSNVATVSVTINSVNDAPVASNGNLNTDEDTQVTGKLNASDADGNSLTFSIVNQPSKGTIQNLNAATGDYVYVPNANATGSDSFTFKANDGVVNSNTATITVNLNAINDPPVASNSSISTNEDTVHTGTLFASDPDGDALFYSIESSATNGTAVITNTATGTFRYTPNANATGSDSFTFKVRDGSVDSNIATITITIYPVNDAPVANNGSITTDEDTAKSGTLSASDLDSTSLTYSIVSNGSKGSTVITNASTGAFTYTPNANANGGDSFTFRVSDGSLNSNTATISVTINPVNDAPVANNGSVTTDEDTAKSGTLSASDIDSTSLTYSIVSNGSKGSVSITNASTGAFTYTPNANANGSDSFTFRASDGSLNSNTATISVTINPVNDAPVANSSTFITTEDRALSAVLNGSDIDGDTFTFSIVANGTKGRGTITDVQAGSFTYSPFLDANGVDSFTFKVNDGLRDSNVSTVTLKIYRSGWSNAENLGPGDFNSPKVAFSPNGIGRVVWPVTGGYRSNTFDPSRGWLGSTFESSLDFPENLWWNGTFAIHASGNGMAVYFDYPPGTNYTIRGPWARKHEAGIGWQGSQYIGTPTGWAGNAGKPSVGILPNGAAIAVWAQHGNKYDDRTQHVFYNTFIPGSGWQGALQLDDGSATANNPDFSVGPSGVGMAIWQQFNSPTSSGVITRIYKPGIGWESPVRISTNFGLGKSVFSSTQETALAVLDLGSILASTYRLGSGWEPLTSIENYQYTVGNLHAAFGPLGKAIAAWDDNGCSIWVNVFDSLLGWDKEMMLKSDCSLSNPRYRPNVAFGPDGRAIVAWAEENSTWASIYVEDVPYCPDRLTNSPYAGGSGTIEEPFTICTAEQLHAIGSRPQDWSKAFRLKANIDLSAYDGSTVEKTFNLIGESSSSPFSGIFDGNGFQIRNFIYDQNPSMTYVGLFRYVADGTIKNLGLTNVRIKGVDAVGSLVGFSTIKSVTSGTNITNCYVKGGSVIATGGAVGGLVGNNNDRSYIRESYSTASVSGAFRVGGLVGTSFGTVENSFATGSVTATSHIAGGLVGYRAALGGSGGTMVKSYATGSVSAPLQAGGLVGQSGSGSPSALDCYWDKDTTGQTTSSGSPDSNGKTTSQMTWDASIYQSVGWDLTNIWVKPSNNYPILRNTAK